LFLSLIHYFDFFSVVKPEGFVLNLFDSVPFSPH